MARLSPPVRSLAAAQLAAVARMRWQLATRQVLRGGGTMELLSRALIALAVLLGGLAGALPLGIGAFWFVSQAETSGLALLLWPVLAFWQLFPVMATALTQNLDTSDLLRFPLRYPLYFAIRLVYGAVEPASLICSLWLLGILAGIGAARPALLPLSALALLTFALLNVISSRLVFAWIERWLARRSTREMLMVGCFLSLMGVQLAAGIGWGAKSMPASAAFASWLKACESVSPPALTAGLIAPAAGPKPARLESCLGLSLYGAALLLLLDWRWQAQFRGENLSQVAARSAPARRPSREASASARSELLARSRPRSLTILWERELRHFSRSAPVLLTLITPLFMLFLLRHAARPGAALGFTPALAFPLGAAYSMLLLSNLVYNQWGGEGCFIQFFFLSPVKFSQAVLAKNLAHATLYTLQIALVWLTVCVRFAPPPLAIVAATAAGALFAAPLNLAAGNLLSLYAPRRIDLSRFGRQRAASVTIVLSLVLQAAIFGLGALVLLGCLRRGTPWLASPIFLAASALSAGIYGAVFGRLEGMARDRKELLVRELCRA